MSCRKLIWFVGLLCSVPLHAAPARVAVEAFPLSQTELLDSPFKRAMERNAGHLLSLEPDRLLHNTRKYCGLDPKGELYGGWESRGIAGHSLGHYLTAISQQYAATGDPRFRERIDYVIAEMAECQERYGDGYIGALPPKELETMRAFEQGRVEPMGSFNFKGGAWVPWSTAPWFWRETLERCREPDRFHTPGNNGTISALPRRTHRC